MLIHDHNFRKKSGDGNFEKRYFKVNTSKSIYDLIAEKE